MTTAASPSSQLASRWPSLSGGIAWILRNATLRALVGVQLIALLIILLRSYGWLQPLELMAYDALLTGWAQPMPRDRIVLVGQTEDYIDRLERYPLSDDDFADLLERLASWHPRVIAVDIYRNFPVPPGTERLYAVLRSHPEIVWGFKLSDDVAVGSPLQSELRPLDPGSL